MSRLRVAVLRGGAPASYERSLASGTHLLSLLRQLDARYEPLDVFVSKDGEWYVHGIVEEPQRVLGESHVVWNTLDRDRQALDLIERVGKPYIGSRFENVSRLMDREYSKQLFAEHSMPTPRHVVFEARNFTDKELMKIFRNMLAPLAVKPANRFTGLGHKVAHSFHEFKEAVKHLLYQSDKVIIEEFLRGQHVTCTVVIEARGVKHYALRPMPATHVDEHKIIEELARKAHRVFGLGHISRSNFIVTPKGGVYLTSVDHMPEFGPGTHLDQSLDALGWHPRDFVDHTIKLALTS